MALLDGNACSAIELPEDEVDTALLLHDRLATSLLLFMAAVGLWGMVLFLQGGSIGGSIAGALVIGQVLAVLQGAMGVVLYADGLRPESSTHLLYGATAVVALPFIWSYARDRHPRQALFFYSLGALFMAGLALRGMATGT